MHVLINQQAKDVLESILSNKKTWQFWSDFYQGDFCGLFLSQQGWVAYNASECEVFKTEIEGIKFLMK